MPVVNVTKLIENRVQAIHKYHIKSGLKRAELDVSGGVDSAVMLGLLAPAVGSKNITAVYQGINSSEDSLKRAREAAKTFDVRLIEIDLSSTFSRVVDDMIYAMTKAGYPILETETRLKNDPTILGSIRSTLRAPVGRGFNRLSGNGIRHGTGNEDEDRFMRFYQRGGDGEVDTNPISMLSKGEVFQLALGLGVPHSIVSARPSPDLWGNGEEHNDENEIAAYLNLKDCGETMYSYIDLNTGKYIRVGMIERISRFMDEKIGPNQRTNWDRLTSEYFSLMANITSDAIQSSSFLGVSYELIERALISAQRVELKTRYKFNPNCPSLGGRKEMLGVCLTDALPNI